MRRCENSVCDRGRERIVRGAAVALVLGVGLSWGWSQDRQWIVVEKQPGQAVAMEAASLEVDGPVATVTDAAGKKASFNASAIREKLPMAPGSIEGVTKEAIEQAIATIEKVSGRFPGAAAGLKEARGQWERLMADLQQMDAKKAEIAGRVEAYLTASIDEMAQYSPQDVQAKVQEGEALIAEAPDKEADLRARIEAWQKKLAATTEPMQAEGQKAAEKPEMAAIANEELKLSADFKLKVPQSALRPNVVSAGVVALILSTMFFFYTVMHGLGKLLRLRASAFVYLGIGLGGLALYMSAGQMLLEIPEDFAALKQNQKGDLTLIEPVVAFAQKYPEIQGDTAPFADVSLQDSSLNAFLAQRLEFVPRQPQSPLDVKRQSLFFDIRQDAILVYTDVTMLGQGLLVTLYMPVSVQDDVLTFGEPRGRLGNVTMPRPLAVAFWREFEEGLGKALEGARLTRAFALHRVSDHAAHLVLKP